MAIRLEKSGELMMIYGTQDEPDDQKEWNARRRKLAALVLAVAAVTATFYLGPHVPGHEVVSNAFKSVLTAIW
jgi:hypothetical protein